MKKIPHKLLKVCRGFFFSFILFFCIASFPIAFAQQVGIENIAGVCGQTTATSDACKLQDIGKITKGVLTVIISVGLPLLVVFVAYRFIIAWFAAQQGQTNAYHDAVSKAKNAILGFMFIIAIFGGLFFVLLQLLGVNNQLFTPLKNILLGASLFPHAYAAETSMLPNFLPYNSLNELLFALIRLVMRFFVYPLLIVIWVWTGFLFVFAQGSPEGLKKAKDLLMKALISSLVIFSIQGFILAAQGTVTKVLGGNTTTSTTSADAGSPCLLDKRIPGTIDSNGNCKSNTNSAVQTTSTSKPAEGTACLLDKRIAGKYGKDGICHSNTQAPADVACTRQRGGTCIKKGVPGTCVDWNCVP